MKQEQIKNYADLEYEVLRYLSNDIDSDDVRKAFGIDESKQDEVCDILTDLQREHDDFEVDDDGLTYEQQKQLEEIYKQYIMKLNDLR